MLQLVSDRKWHGILLIKQLPPRLSSMYLSRSASSVMSRKTASLSISGRVMFTTSVLQQLPHVVQSIALFTSAYTRCAISSSKAASWWRSERIKWSFSSSLREAASAMVCRLISYAVSDKRAN